MQHTSANDSHTASFPTRGLQAARTRIGYTLAGIFVFAGVGAAVHAATAVSDNSLTPADPSTVNQAGSQLAAPADAADGQRQTQDSTSTVHASVSSNGASTPDVHLQVNGQDIPVPVNGSSQQTITGEDGSQTSVSSNSTVSSEGDASNSSTTTFSLNVDSSSTGGSTTAP